MYQHDPLTQRIIGCAIEVHRELGPGLLEATYEEALCIELNIAGWSYSRQVGVPVSYKGHLIGEHRTWSLRGRSLSRLRALSG